MQQRRLRLGDVLDDYCPRERRVTNHAVVAIVGDDVRQTRCTTCDAEHEYRQAKVPPPRKAKAGVAALAADAPGGRPVRAPQRAESPAPSDEPMLPATLVAAPDANPPASSAAGDAPLHAAIPMSDAGPSGADFEPASTSPESEGGRDDDGPVHRPLIRATFPRPEGQLPAWREPEFTIRQPTGHRGRGHGQQSPGGQRFAGGRGFGGDGAWGRGPGNRGGQRGAGGPRQGGGFGRGPRHGGGGPGRKSGR